jgi:hypothetical protein
LAQGVPRELQKFYKVLNTIRYHKIQALVDAQTKQWVRPPTMKIRAKCSICHPKPSKREHLDFIQQVMHRTCCVSE